MHKLLLTLVLASILGACETDNLKEPTTLSFEITIDTTDNQSNNFLQFTGGSINLSEFSFEGKRLGSDDVYFEKSFPNGLIVSFLKEETNNELLFTVPKGTYYFTEITFETFDDNSQPTIITNGVFLDGNTTTPILFEFLSNEYFTVQSAEEKTISTNSSFTIQLDPNFWFSTITTNDLNSADKKSINGVPTIYISEDFNDNIYDIVADKLDESLALNHND